MNDTKTRIDTSHLGAVRIFREPGLLGPYPIVSYLGMAVVVVSLIIAGVIVGEIIEHALQDGWLGTASDRTILRFTVAHRAGWLTDFMRQTTELGGSRVLIPVTVLATFGLLLIRRFRLAMVMVIALVGSQFFTFVLKTIIERPRPGTNGEIIFASDSSFPSGHALESAVVYIALAFIIGSLMTSRRCRLGVWTAGLVLSFGIGASRIYLGVHWTSDVAAGWGLGIVLVTSIVGLALIDRHMAHLVWFDSRIRTLAARFSILSFVAIVGATAFSIGVSIEVF